MSDSSLHQQEESRYKPTFQEGMSERESQKLAMGERIRLLNCQEDLREREMVQVNIKCTPLP